jgi:hypothetical protein
MSNASGRVLSGPYAGFTRAEMQAEFSRYKTALTSSGSALAGASISGQSVSFGPRRDWSLAEWGRQVQTALAQVDPSFCSPSQTIAVRFAQD